MSLLYSTKKTNKAVKFVCTQAQEEFHSSREDSPLAAPVNKKTILQRLSEDFQVTSDSQHFRKWR